MIVYCVYLISRMYVNTLENRGNNPASIHTKCIQIEPKFHLFVQYIALTQSKFNTSTSKIDFGI